MCPLGSEWGPHPQSCAEGDLLSRLRIRGSKGKWAALMWAVGCPLPTPGKPWSPQTTYAFMQDMGTKGLQFAWWDVVRTCRASRLPRKSQAAWEETEMSVGNKYHLCLRDTGAN